MNQKSQIELQGFGTSEGVSKEWDERGRGRKLTDSLGNPDPRSEWYPASGAGGKRNWFVGRRKGGGEGSETSVGSDGNHRKFATYESARRHAEELNKKELQGQAAGGQTDSSSFIGRKYRVVDLKYNHAISEHDNPEEAERAARARPYSKVVSWPQPENSQKLRDIARKRLVRTNPDVT